MPKGDLEALVAELRLYISPKPLSPNHRALNAEKTVAISLYYLKDTASIGIVVNSFGVAICTVHCVKSIHIRSYFWSEFSCIWIEYGDLLRKSPYSIRLQKLRTEITEITDQK